MYQKLLLRSFFVCAAASALIGIACVIWLRRLLPHRWFERLYFGHIVRLVTRPGPPVTQLSELSLPGNVETDYLGLAPRDRKE